MKVAGLKTAQITALLALSLMLLTCGCATFGEERPQAPVTAADFNLKLAGGGEATLSQFKGRPLVINFGASWCPHCQNELPALKKGYDKYKGQVEFLVVFLKSPEKDVTDLIEKNSIEFKVGLDPEAQVGKAYGVKGFPITYFIDGDGNVVDDYFGGIAESTLSKKIDSLLKKK